MSVARKASFSYPRQWSPRVVPTWPVELDASKSISSGLIDLKIYDRATANNIIGPPVSPAASGVPVIATSAIGAASSFAGTINVGWTKAGNTCAGLSAWSVNIIMQCGTSSGTLFSERASSGNDLISVLGFNTNFIAINFRNDAATIIQALGSSFSVSDGSIHLVSAVFNGTNLALYIDGKLDKSIAWGGANSFTNANIRTMVGFDNVDNNAWSGRIFSIGCYNRALGQSEIAAYAAEPFAMLRPLIRRQFYYAGALIRRRPLIVGAY